MGFGAASGEGGSGVTTIDLKSRVVGYGVHRHLVYGDSVRAICSLDMSDSRHATGDEKLCARCWEARESMARRGWHG